MESQPFDDLWLLSVAAGAALMLTIVAGASAWRTRGRSAAARVVCTVLIVSATVGVLAVTVAPGPGSGRHVNFVPFRGILAELGKRDERIGLLNVAGNVLMFSLPCCLTRFAWDWSVRRTVTSGLVVSLLIEVVQYAQDAGRSSDIDDVLLNTAGAGIGAVAAAVAARALTPRRA